MNKNDIMIEIYSNKKIESYCRTLAGNDWEELKSEMIIQIYKMKDFNLEKAIENNYLDFLCMTICKRIYWGNSSGKGGVKDTGIFYNYKSLIDFDGEKMKEKYIDNIDDDFYDKLSLVNDCLDKLHWYDKTLFTEYYNEGLKLREISEKYDINIKSIHHSISKSRLMIKKLLGKI